MMMREFPIETVVRLYQSGLSSVQIANKLKITKKAILKHIKLRNLTRPLSTALRRYTINEDFFEKIDSEEKAYWLGFILADGNVAHHGRNNKSRSFRISLKGSDIGHIEKFKKAIGASHPIKALAVNGHQACCFKVTSKRFVESLENLGWQEFKREGNTKILTSIPQELQSHLLRGLIDGDGWICVSRGTLRLGFCDLHRSVVNYVSASLSRDGIPKFSKQPRNNKAFRTYISGREAIAAVNRLYSGAIDHICLTRKLERARIILRAFSENPDMRLHEFPSLEPYAT